MEIYDKRSILREKEYLIKVLDNKLAIWFLKKIKLYFLTHIYGKNIFD